MSNFTKITSAAGYPKHVRIRSAQSMLLSAAFYLGRNTELGGLLVAMAHEVSA